LLLLATLIIMFYITLHLHYITKRATVKDIDTADILSQKYRQWRY